MRPDSKTRWGVDFGNVIVRNLSHETRLALMQQLVPETSRFEDEAWLKEADNFLRHHSALMPEALEGLSRLVRRNGQENVWIVSRASGLERLFNRRLMFVHDIFATTGLAEDHVVFVNRYDEKADVCRDLSLQGHIDDHGEVLYHLQEICPRLVWFIPKEQDLAEWRDRFNNPPIVVGGWQEITL